MTKVYFVRHAEPVHAHEDDRTRPLTAEGLADRKIVLETLKDKKIDVFYCSPYVRSMATIEEAAAFFEKEIHTDERLSNRRVCTWNMDWIAVLAKKRRSCVCSPSPVFTWILRWLLVNSEPDRRSVPGGSPVFRSRTGE